MEQVANAIVLGSIFTLFALGLSLCWGALDVLNLAHGAIFVASAWAGAAVASSFALPFVLAVIFTMFIGAILAVALELAAFGPIRALFTNKRQAELAMVAVGVGAGVLIDSIVGEATYNQTFFMPQSTFQLTSFRVCGISLTNIQLIIIVASVVVALGLHFWISRSRQGMAMRAVAFSSGIPPILGVRVRRVALSTMAMSGALAGLAGVLLLVSSSGMAVSTGHAFLLKAFAIVVLGGVGSVAGCVLAAYILAFSETLIVSLGTGGLRDGVAFALILLILLVRPQGLFGRRQSVRV